MLNYILVYINIILINVLLLNCYNINNFGFYTLNFIVLGSMLVYYIFSQIIKKIPKKIYKFVFVISFLGVLTYIIYLNWDNIFEFILDLNNKALYLISNIYARRIIEFGYIKSLWFIILPLIVWLFMMLCNRKLQMIIFIFTLAIGFYLNYAGFRSEFINNINLFTFILIFNIVVIYFIKRYLNTIESENELEVNYRSIIFIVGFVFISFSIFMVFNSSDMSMNYELKMANIGSNLSTDIRDFLKIADTKKVISGTSLIAFNEEEVFLGGDLKQNEGTVLTLKTEGPIKYLRARTRDYYSGNSWKNTFKSFSTKENDMVLQYPPTLTGPFSAVVNLSQAGNRRLAAPLYSFEYDNDNIRYNTNDFTCESNNVNTFYSFNYYTQGFLFDDSYIGKERRYLELPPNISQDIMDLTHEIINDEDSKSEKINKIVNYLRTNCKYSLNVSPVPKDREFVDYFVNTSKKGYCTYFATSAVIMLRIAGIESRYVEGYMVKDNKDESGAYIVKNKDAHAWAEARVGNNMWISVDAVPEVDALDSQFAQNNTPIPLAPIEDEEQYFHNKTSANSNNNSSSENNADETQNNDSINFKGILKTMDDLKWYIKAPFTLSLLSILFFSFKYLLFIYRKNKFINSQNISYCHVYFLNHLNKIGYRKNNDETNLEFSETINDEEIKKIFINFIYKFNREVYGNKKVNFTKEDRIKLFEYINSFYVSNTKIYNRIFSF